MDKDIKKEIYNDIKAQHISINNWFPNGIFNEAAGESSICDGQKIYNSLWKGID